MFTQHAAEAENADNAAEQKRQMNKRVRYGEIVQVLSNKWKHEENTIQVVSFTLKKTSGILHVGHVNVYFINLCIFYM